MIEQILIPSENESGFACDICAAVGCIVIVKHDKTPPVKATADRCCLMVWMCSKCVAKSPDVQAMLQKPEFVLAMLRGNDREGQDAAATAMH